jgi:hypothetical protein
MDALLQMLAFAKRAQASLKSIESLPFAYSTVVRALQYFNWRFP